MDTPQTIPELVTWIEQAMQRVTTAINSLSPVQMQAARLADGRSVKDVLGHLTWWDQWLLVTLPTDQNTPATPITLPLADQIPPGDHWADEMNAKVLRYNQPRTLAAIQAEFTATCNHLLQRVAQLTTADLYDVQGLTAHIGQPAAPLILGIYEHYEEHAHELEQLHW